MPINNPINHYNEIQNNGITTLDDLKNKRVSEIIIEREQKIASNEDARRNEDAIHQFQEIQSDYIKNKQIKETIQDDLNQENTSDIYLSISKEAYRLSIISQEQNKEIAIAKYFEEENKIQVINNVKNIERDIQDNNTTEISEKNVNNQRAIFEYQIISEMRGNDLSENQSTNSSVVDSNIAEQQRINDLFNYNESQNIDNPIL